MSTRQHNRGPHPADELIFGREQWPALQGAVEHLSWLLSRGYAPTGSLKLVGDRFSLVARQRTAVLRSACSDEALRRRRSKAIALEQLHRCNLEIDAFNFLITLEAALSGGVVLRARVLLFLGNLLAVRFATISPLQFRAGPAACITVDG